MKDLLENFIALKYFSYRWRENEIIIYKIVYVFHSVVEIFHKAEFK